MIKRIIILLSIFLISFWVANASNNDKINTFYDRYYNNLLTKTNSKLEVIQALETLDLKLKKAIKVTKNKNNKILFYSIVKINSQKLELLKNDNLIQKWLDNKTYDLSKIVDEIIILDENLYYKNEFSDDIFGYSIRSYYNLNSESYNFFLKRWISDYKIFKVWNKVLISNKFTKQRVFSHKEIYEKFLNKIDITNWNYIWLIDGKYYFFEFSANNIYTFNWEYASIEQINKYWFDIDKSLIFLNDWNYWFVKNFKKIELFDESFLQNIPNLDEFLFYLSDDLINVKIDTKTTLESIKDLSLTLTKNLNNDQEKIKVIYDWIVENISYYENFVDWNKDVFSWTKTYLNKYWVCDWYTKIFLFMLSFAWVENVEIKRWFAFVSEYFPSFWHAWLKIWDKYYDPTFDDPIWWSREEYLYFAIPEDLMYINRFDWVVIKDNLDKKSFIERQKIAEKNLFDVYDKYSNFALAKTIKNKIDLWFSYNDEITVEALWQKIDTLDITSEINVMYYFENGQKKYIKSINYYPLNNENLVWVMKNYNIEISKLKIWKFSSNWKIFYWLIYNLTLY